MKKIYTIEGLDCANCAREVEEYLNKDKVIQKATIDFVGKKLFVQYDEESYTREELESLISSVENGVSLSDYKGNSEAGKKKNFLFSQQITIIRLVISSVILAFAYFWNLPNIVGIFLFVMAYLISGIDVIYQMFRNMWKGRIFTEYTLMTVATIGALCIQEFPEAVLVMVLYQIGEMLQDAAVSKSRKRIQSTLSLRPKTATLVKEGHLFLVEPDSLQINDLVDIKVGDILPIDGMIVEGEGTIDMSSLTGESVPVAAHVGDEVYSGSHLFSGHLVVQVSKTYEDSTISKVIELIETNGEKKSKAEKFVTKFASIYTPIVFVIALLLAIIPSLFVWSWRESIYRALIFLVVSCPCSIVISVPLAYFVSMGKLAKHGVIVKGANYLDILTQVRTVVMDKTGTLTKGKFQVTKVVSENISEDLLLEYAVAAESISHHPIAKSILASYSGKIEDTAITNPKEIAGIGTQVTYKNHTVAVGNHSICPEAPEVDAIATIVYVTVDGNYAGYLLLEDEIKEDSLSLIDQLHAYKAKTIMLTGDKQEYAMHVAEQLHIDEVHAELLPSDKSEALEKIIEEGNKVLYIGDGVNDAPSIMRADVGMAMGGIGSEVAIEAADVVIMNDKVDKVIYTMKVAHSTKATAIFNVCFALFVKLSVYILTLFGFTSMWLALFADVGVTLLLILNSILLQKRG